MNTIQTKRILKKKKRITSLLNSISKIDETTIKFIGNKNDNLFKIIRNSLEDALSRNTDLEDWILNMDGLSGRKYRILINQLIKRIKDPRYLEIGSWLGSTACSASFKNKIVMTCIDNWSENFLPKINPKKEFMKNIKDSLTSNSEFNMINKDFRKVDFNELKNFNIYFYDGSHTYNDHYDAVKLVLPAMSKKFIMIIDDWNWNQVREATLNAIKDKKLKVIAQLEIKTTNDGSSSIIVSQNSDWHQGCIFFVIEK
jgi:hypothetical protein